MLNHIFRDFKFVVCFAPLNRSEEVRTHRHGALDCVCSHIGAWWGPPAPTFWDHCDANTKLLMCCCRCVDRCSCLLCDIFYLPISSSTYRCTHLWKNVGRKVVHLIVLAVTFRKMHGREFVSFHRVASFTAHKYLRRIIVLFLVSHCITVYNICNTFNIHRVDSIYKV